MNDLVSFGNYLLSEEREQSVRSNPELADSVEERLRQVSDADIANWNDRYGNI